MKVLYVSSEAQPFISTGGLADVAGSLPKALRKRLIGARVVMPLYDTIPAEYKDKMTFITSISVPVAWRRQYCGIFQAKLDGVIFYFIDNQYYFKRDTLYGHYDDAERFTFFARAVLEILPHIDWKPDIIHCNDWQSALTPVFYNTFYSKDPWYSGIKTVFTIHNIQYQGQYGTDLIGDVIGLRPEDAGILEWGGCVNFMKGAIETANRVTTVSPSYAEEILDAWYSHGLDPILRDKQWKLSGILNGIDTVSYDPETDPNLAVNYSISDIFEGKAEDKRVIQENMGLPQRADVPLVAMISRLVSHKGLDLCKAVFEEMLEKEDIQVIVLGSGDWQYESFFQSMANKYPNKFAVRIGFVPSLARKLYGGADMLLMPSKSEPCGLSQMIALRYGTVPIVRMTGGLKDSITDSGDGEGNGFTFFSYNAHDMYGAIKRAIAAYHSDYWKTLVTRAAECDFSWGRSANAYIKMYKDLLKE